jgi:hypothetical protein
MLRQAVHTPAKAVQAPQAGCTAPAGAPSNLYDLAPRLSPDAVRTQPYCNMHCRRLCRARQQACVWASPAACQWALAASSCAGGQAVAAALLPALAGGPMCIAAHSNTECVMVHVLYMTGSAAYCKLLPAHSQPLQLVSTNPKRAQVQCTPSRVLK